MGTIGEPIEKTLLFGMGVFYPLLGTFLLLLVAYYYWLQNQRYVKMANKMPGPAALPIVGNALEAIMLKPQDVIEFCIGKTWNYDKVFRAWLGPKLFVFLINPEDVEIILGSNTHIEKAEEYHMFEPWLGEGLLISKGEKWKTHRKMIAPTFHSSILKTFIPVFNKNSAIVVEKLRKEVGRTFDVHDYMSGITVEILLETAMGVKKEEENHAGFDYAMAVMKMCNILHQRHYKFWLRPDFLFKLTGMAKEQVKLLSVIHGLTKKVLKKKKEEYKTRKTAGETSIYQQLLKNSAEEKNFVKVDKSDYVILRDDLDENEENDVGEKKRLAFLDFMIEASEEGNKLNDNEIKEEVDTIMFEGHDTTAAGSSFVLCVLGAYPDIQEKVYQELREIFQDSKRPCTFTDTLEMKYLERVIFETFRLYPPVPIIARMVREDVKLASGDYTIPANTNVVIGTFRLHRQESSFPNPDQFDPDNFLPERCVKRHHYSYIPFSAGPRSCVGRKYAMLKLKVLLSTILRNFKVVSHVDAKDFKLLGDIILKRSDGFTVEIEERK